VAEIGGGLNRTTFAGLASGLDTKLLISSMLAYERRPLNLLEGRRDDLQKQQSLYRDLNTKLLALRDASRDIDNLTSTMSGTSVDEEFLEFTTSSSDDDILTATATGDATPGSYDIRVEQMALQPREITDSFSSSSDVIAAEGETLDIDFGVDDERNYTITVESGGASLQDIRDLINEDDTNDGDVRAEILFDGTEYRLMISGVEFGADNDFTISGTGAALGDADFLDSGLNQDGTDAKLTVLGVAVTSSSNTVEGALPGVTFEIHGVNDPDKSTEFETMTISLDNEDIEANLQKFVDAFNGVADFMNSQFKVDRTTNRSGPLSNDNLLRYLQTSLQTVVTDQYSFSGNSFTSLNDIGVQFTSDGKLSIDSDTLEEALATSPQSVREVLSGDGTDVGAAAAIATQLKQIVQFGDGTMAVRDDSLNTQINGLKDQIERFESRLLMREETLLQRFGRLEAMISSLQAQEAFLGGFRR
jgi:flagellar hook-associated protein 2